MYPDTSVDTINEVTTMAEHNEPEITMDVMYDANNYIEAFNKCKKCCIWKSSLQRYEMNLLRNINRIHNELQSNTYKQESFNEFVLSERGKTRYIKSVCIYDRVVIRVLCDKILTPSVKDHLIYDNGASLKGKGISFTRERLKTHLRKFYRTNGSNDGYVLLIDFRKFFDNIIHTKLIELYESLIKDTDIIQFIKDELNNFNVDVSYLTDEEYENCINEIYNSLEHAMIDDKLLTGDKILHKSLGIGSQISQISGLLYPSKIDNFCKIVKSIKYYGRYMDDTYIIHNDKEYLKSLLIDIKEICDSYGIFINHKKTQIYKLSKGFKFLKRYYILTDTGKVIDLVDKSTFSRERIKLKKYRKLVDSGQMSLDDVENSYKSYVGTLKGEHCYNSLKSLDALYNELFDELSK